MEHNCPKCGALVEDGAPFCQECNAPQIRVSSGDNDAATPPLPPGTPDEMQPPAEPVTPESRPHWQHPMMQAPSGVDWKVARRVAIIAGVIGGVGSFLGIFGFLLVLAAGGITITLYQHRLKGARISAADGFRIGSFTGLISGLLYSTMLVIPLFVEQGRSSFRGMISQQLAAAAASKADVNAQIASQKITEFVATNSGLATLIGLAAIAVTLIFIVLAGLGGSIGASLFGKQREPVR